MPVRPEMLPGRSVFFGIGSVWSFREFNAYRFFRKSLSLSNLVEDAVWRQARKASFLMGECILIVLDLNRKRCLTTHHGKIARYRFVKGLDIASRFAYCFSSQNRIILSSELMDDRGKDSERQQECLNRVWFSARD